MSACLLKTPTTSPGDVVSVEVDGLGMLTNHVVAGPLPVAADYGAQPTATVFGAHT